MKRLINICCPRGTAPLLVALLALPCLSPKFSFAQYFSAAGPGSGFDGYVTTAGSYSPLAGTAMRQVTDLEVLGAVGTIGLHFTRIYNSAYATLGTVALNGHLGKQLGLFADPIVGY